MRFSAVIFDFDGTLCDTGPGIMNSAAYALEAYGFEVPREPGALRCFIGPPLLVTFQEQFGADAATAQALVQKYRERYNGAILNESMLYRGIVTLLENLKAAGIRIGIASSKPKRYIDQLLAHFTIDKFFDAVCGVDFKTDCESQHYRPLPARAGGRPGNGTDGRRQKLRHQRRQGQRLKDRGRKLGLRQQV